MLAKRFVSKLRRSSWVGRSRVLANAGVYAALVTRTSIEEILDRISEKTCLILAWSVIEEVK